MNPQHPFHRTVAIFISGVLFWQPLLASTQQAGQSAAAVHAEQALHATGALIASTDKAQVSGYNRFDTGSFSQEDLYNVAEYEASGFGIGAGFGVNGKEGKQGNMTPQGARNPGGSAQGSGKGSTVASADLGYGFDRDKDTSTTYSYIGTTDKRPDSGALGNNFDAAKVQKEIELQVSVTQQFSQNWKAARKDLSLAKDTLKQKLDAKQIDQAEYDKQVSTLGQITLLLDTVGAGLSAPTNSVGGILAAAASPTLAQAIGSYYKARDKEGSLGHLLAHGVLAASVAAAGGNDPLTAALAAGSAEALTPLVSKWLYGTSDQSKLNADQKSTLSAIAGLAGAGIGATTGDMASTVASGQLAQNAVENNRQADPKKDIYFLHDKARVARFKDAYEKKYGKNITLAEAERLLDRAGSALLGEDWAAVHGKQDELSLFTKAFLTQELAEFPARYAAMSVWEKLVYVGPKPGEALVVTPEQYADYTLGAVGLMGAAQARGFGSFFGTTEEAQRYLDNIRVDPPINPETKALYDKYFWLGAQVGQEAKESRDYGIVLKESAWATGDGLVRPVYGQVLARFDQNHDQSGQELSIAVNNLLFMQGNLPLAGYLEGLGTGADIRDLSILAAAIGVPTVGTLISRLAGMVKPVVARGGVETTRVGRWMSQAEYNAMMATGKVQESFSGVTHVATPAEASAFIKQAKPGSVYVEFDVPTSSLKATNAEWSKILGPNTPEGRLAARKGLEIPQMPAATNIIHKATKLP